MKDRSIAAPLVILSLLVFAPLVIAQTSPTPEPVAKPSPSVPPADYDLRWAVKIPMRDKVELNALRYEMEFTGAQYFRGRSATRATSKSVHRGIWRSVPRNFHREAFHFRQKFWRHVQN